MIRVRLFAGLRERAGWATRELHGVTRVADVWAALGLGEQPQGLLYAVNREYAPPERELVDGDEVALIPSVGRCVPPVGKAARAGCGRLRGGRRAGRCDRHVHRDDPGGIGTVYP